MNEFGHHELIRTAFEAAPNGMILVDAEGTILLVNGQVEKIFGFHRSELMGEGIEILVPDAIREQHPAYVQSFIEAPTPRAMGAGRELFGRCKDGSMVRVEIGLNPVSINGKTTVIASVVDVSARYEAARQLRETNEEREQFAFRASHDLRSPLGTIAQIADCVVEDLDTGDLDEARSNVVKIKKSAQRLSQLVEDILVLTQAGVDREATGEFRFDVFMDSVQLQFDHLIKSKEVSIRHEFGHGEALRTQVTRLSQVLTNLISNAIKYRDTGKDACFVTLRTYTDQDGFHLEVEDNGIGIPEQRSGEMFGMFKRFHQVAVEGSGLGLYIVKKHLGKLGGSIDFESSEAGTVFRIILPNGEG